MEREIRKDNLDQVDPSCCALYGDRLEALLSLKAFFIRLMAFHPAKGFYAVVNIEMVSGSCSSGWICPNASLRAEESFQACQSARDSI